MPYYRHWVLPRLVLALRWRPTTSCVAPRSSPLWREVSSLNNVQTTSTCTFCKFLRSVTPSSLIGCPPMLYDWGSSLSHWGTEPVIDCQMHSLIRSLLEMTSPRPFSANASPLTRLQRWGQTLVLLFSGMESPYMKLGKGSRTLRGSAPSWWNLWLI